MRRRLEAFAEELKTTKADISGSVIFDQNAVNDAFEEVVWADVMIRHACVHFFYLWDLVVHTTSILSFM